MMTKKQISLAKRLALAVFEKKLLKEDHITHGTRWKVDGINIWWPFNCNVLRGSADSYGTWWFGLLEVERWSDGGYLPNGFYSNMTDEELDLKLSIAGY